MNERMKKTKTKKRDTNGREDRKIYKELKYDDEYSGEGLHI